MLDRAFMLQIKAEEQVGNKAGADLLRSQQGMYKLTKDAGLIRNELSVVNEFAPALFKFSNEHLGALRERAKKEGKEVACYEIRPKSLAVQLAENPEYFGHVNDSEVLRSLVVPVSFEAAVFVDKKTKRGIPIAESNSLPLNRQRDMIEDGFSQDLKVPGVKAIMAHAYVDSQLDIEHQKQTGRKLLVGFFARTPDQTFGSYVADVGRIDPGRRLDVGDWSRDDGDRNVFAFPVVVLADLEI